MQPYNIDPMRQFLVTGKYVNHCNVRGCQERPVKETYLCQKHLDRALKYFSGQLGLDPLHHMKHDVQLHYGTAWTYFVGSREQEVVKIGMTTKLKARMSSLRNSSPIPIKLFAVAFGSPDIELVLHERFAADRLHGEWFKLTDEVNDCIESIKSHDLGKYVPERMYFQSTEERALHLAGAIKGRPQPNSMRDKTPVLDFLNGC